MSPWSSSAAFATFYKPEDIAAAATSEGINADTPVLSAITEARAKGYDSVCVSLTTEKWKKRWRDMCILPAGTERDKDSISERISEDWRLKPAFNLDEVTMTRLDEAEFVVAMVSQWLELDAVDDWVRHDAEIALQQELAYASYLNLTTAILPPPRNRKHVASYGRAINACLKNTPFIQLSIRLPIYDPSVFQSKSTPQERDSATSFFSSPVPSTPPKVVVPDPSSLKDDPKPPRASEGELDANWEMWDVIRSICDYNPRLTLTLDLTPPLPSASGILNKWSSEPVRHIFLPASTFIANSKGYPVLPKGTQAFIRDSMTHRPTVIFANVKSGLHSRGGEQTYSQYIRHLEKTSPTVQATQNPGTLDNFAQGYHDFLQAPLQPLMHNLQSITYQTFEQDPVKYRNYEEAIYRALVDWPKSNRIVICVAGAGRGPLVARCLTAIERSRREAFVYAIEKNPNAYVTLQGRQQREWGTRVKLLYGDMRYVEIPEKGDILVSELLGSFGDNELSPECIDGAVRFLKPDGISIPSSYSAHIAPLSSSKLYNETHSISDIKNAETPYVVMFQAVNILSGDGGGLSGKCGSQIQECWEFEHPRKDVVLDAQGLPLTNSHNVRSSALTFYIPHAGIVHGVAGYFEAVLYGNIGISIHPDRKDQISKDMLSWFPLFFPFKEPLYLPSNSELRVSMWRLTDTRQVWYEWYAESFMPAYHTSLLDDTPKEVSPQSTSSPNPRASFFAASSTPIAAPSPVVDAIDNPALTVGTTALAKPGSSGEDDMVVIKIGQTSLHNPGGRSSWIGL